MRDSGYQGPEGNLPKASVNVTFGAAQIVACHSGPDQGVAEVQTGEQRLHAQGPPPQRPAPR